MGEAKRRKLFDPRFGRSKRGLVVSPPIEIEGTRLYARSSNLDLQELRAWLLFFDKLVWPSSRAIHFPSGPDELFLEQCNILFRPDYTVSGDGAQGIAEGQIRAFQDLDSREPGVWAIAQGENSLLLRDKNFEPECGVLLNFYNAIPVPDCDVPLQEILEFKLKRFDELEKLRLEIDGFVAAVSIAEDKVNEINKRVAMLDTACAEAIRVSHEWQFPVRLANVKTSLDIRPLAIPAGGLTAYITASAIPGLSASAIALSTIGGAVAPLIPALKVETTFGWRGLRRRLGPYRYVYQIHSQLF